MTSLAAYAVTVTSSSAQARPAKQRDYLGLFNQSATDTVYVAFDAAVTAAATAGQLTLLPLSGANRSFLEWSGASVPQGAVFMRSSGASTPVTVVE